MATAYKITEPISGSVRIVVTDDPTSIRYHINPGESCLEYPAEFNLPVDPSQIVSLL